MISIHDKHLCYGCGACIQVCPMHCIRLTRDEQGFCYPEADSGICTGCGECDSVCPALHRTTEPVHPRIVFAGINKSEGSRAQSSSGGLFTLLAEKVIGEGGSVCGAAFDSDWTVRHIFVESEKDLSLIRGSKYIQSDIGDAFSQVQDILSSGRKLLFSGTGCQIAGLKNFLKKDYDNLLSVEVACHGVPSPSVWKNYLQTVSGGSTVTSVLFREKSAGWKNYNIVIEGTGGTIVKEIYKDNVYMKFFLHDLCLRPSCHTCPFKCGKSGSDIILADYWGIGRKHPQMDDDKGTSLIIINTGKGQQAVKALDFRMEETNYEDGIRKNTSLIQPAGESEYSPEFWDLFLSGGVKEAEEVLNHFKTSRIKSIYIAFRHWISLLLKPQPKHGRAGA